MNFCFVLIGIQKIREQKIIDFVLIILSMDCEVDYEKYNLFRSEVIAEKTLPKTKNTTSHSSSTPVFGEKSDRGEQTTMAQAQLSGSTQGGSGTPE